MGFQNSSKLYIRRLVIALIVVFSAVFGHSRGLVPQINGVSAMILVPLVVSIAMFERSFIGMLYGAFAGILWDMFSVTADGYFAIVLACIGFFSGMIVTFYLRNNIISTFILSFVATSVCSIGYWLFFIYGNSYTDSGYILQRYYLPCILYTMVFVAIYYYIIALVFKLTTCEKRKITY